MTRTAEALPLLREAADRLTELLDSSMAQAVLEEGTACAPRCQSWAERETPSGRGWRGARMANPAAMAAGYSAQERDELKK